MLSTAMSDGVKCRALLNAASDGTVSFPIQKNLKKHNVLAAHSMTVSNSWRPGHHILCGSFAGYGV